ncbi:MAG TPA: hypothetical protein VHB79_13415 [Polyangiaceae bacterium]|nr:hypothetical protein [Polyangiaceae bacterium]
MKFGLFQTALLGAVALSGCTTPPHCDALGKCGGDFLAEAKDLGGGVASQEWVATVPDACVENVPTPPDPPSLALLPPRPAGVRPVEPSTTDWCGGLVLSSDGQGGYKVAAFDDGWVEALKRYNGWFPSIPLWTAQLEVGQGNLYTLQTTQLISQDIELSQNCVAAQGVRLSCGDLSTLLYTAVNEKLNGKSAGNSKGTPLIPGLSAVVYDSAGKPAVSCSDDGQGGCSCKYNLSITTTNSGPWASSNGNISFFDSLAAPVSQTDYCVKGDSLQLSGSKDTDLFNRGALKTITFHKPSCSDGVQSKTLGETGVDCGGDCSPCATK